MLKKFLINSYKAWAVQHQKNVDLEKYSPLELNQALCQFCGELRRVDGEGTFANLLEMLIFLSLKCVHNCSF